MPAYPHAVQSCIDVKWLNKFARKHNDRFLFIHSKGDETVEQRLNQLLAIDADYVDTAVRAFQLHRERSEFVKYKPLDMKDGFLSQAKLMNFVSDLRKGRIDQALCEVRTGRPGAHRCWACQDYCWRGLQPQSHGVG